MSSVTGLIGLCEFHDEGDSGFGLIEAKFQEVARILDAVRNPEPYVPGTDPWFDDFMASCPAAQADTDPS